MIKKHLFPLFIAVILLICGCSTSPNYRTPVRFYYPNIQPVYNDPDGLISYQFSEGDSLTNEQILTNYLQGPEDLNFYNPFPQDVRLVSLKEKDLMVTVMLSNAFAELSGIDATLAAVCLAKTSMELMDADTVAITCESALIDGEQTLIFNKNQILWQDTSIGLVTEATNTTPTQ